MTSDNTTAMKTERAYNRLLCAIIQKKPRRIIDRLVFEAVECPETAAGLEESMKQMKIDASLDANNYYIHYQGGHPVLVLRQSPLGRKLAKGAFKDE